VDFTAFAPLAMNVFGTIMGAKGEYDSARAVKQKAAYEAQQLRVNAGQTEAAGQIDAAAETRKSKLLQSRALALAAASGGGALDPSVVKIISGLAGEGKLASQMQMYNAGERARVMRSQAAATEYGALLESKAHKTKALSTILSGAASIYSTLGGFGSAGADSAGYEGTWTANGPLDTSSYNGLMWDA